ncbi:hypothetical protein ACWDR7_13050, partial [Microbacterium sp. NPDC003461]
MKRPQQVHDVCTGRFISAASGRSVQQPMSVTAQQAPAETDPCASEASVRPPMRPTDVVVAASFGADADHEV